MDEAEAQEACEWIATRGSVEMRIEMVERRLRSMSSDMQVARKGRRRGYNDLAVPYVRAYVHAKVIVAYKETFAGKDPSPEDVLRLYDALEGFDAAWATWAAAMQTSNELDLNWGR